MDLLKEIYEGTAEKVYAIAGIFVTVVSVTVLFWAYKWMTPGTAQGVTVQIAGGFCGLGLGAILLPAWIYFLYRKFG